MDMTTTRSELTQRKSYILNMTINESTVIPTPLASPPASPLVSPISPISTTSSLIRPPTKNGGPLSSHPPSPIDIPSGSWSLHTVDRTRPSTPTRSFTESTLATSMGSRTRPDMLRTRTNSYQNSLRSPLRSSSRSTSAFSPPPILRRDSSGMRRLLSLSSLRNSFSSSRTSLALPPTPINTSVGNTSAVASPDDYQYSVLPWTTSPASVPDYTASMTSFSPEHPQVRKRSSVGWFSRRSQMFLGTGDDMVAVDGVEAGDERDQDSRPATPVPTLATTSTRSEIREAPVTPPPQLPELGALRGGQLTGGALGGEELFSEIGK